jgi:holo-[acyl-carrier protein] synthase
MTGSGPAPAGGPATDTPWGYSIGVDLAEVVRIRSAIRRWGDRFLNKHFTPGELAYCRAKARPAESLAARFAAKEAFAKAFPGPEPLRWQDVEVVMEGRRPAYRLGGAAAGYEAKLTLSHTHAHAVAVAMVRPRAALDAGG